MILNRKITIRVCEELYNRLDHGTKSDRRKLADYTRLILEKNI